MKMKNVEAVYPLSPMQHLMLSHSLSASPVDTLFNQFSYKIYGKLSISAFEKAWEEIVNRHAALRTAFFWENLEKPLQVVWESVTLPWDHFDWRQIDKRLLDEHLNSVRRADQEKGFILTQAPLMRMILVRLSDNDYYFLWSSHHLIIDRWCLSIIMNELLTLYNGFQKGESVILEHPRQFRDYIGWLQNQDLSQAEKFWRNKFCRFPEFSFFSNNSLKRSNEFKHQRFEECKLSLSNDVTVALKNFAQQNQLTRNVLLQGAWALVQSRYSGCENIIFGLTISGRPPDLSGVESMVGSFINNLPRCLHIPTEILFPRWLKYIQEQQVELLEYGYVSLDQIHEWSNIPINQQLIETLVIFLDPVKSKFKCYDYVEICAEYTSIFTTYPITLVLGEDESNIFVRIIYNSNWFNQAEINALLNGYETILERIAVSPERTVIDISAGISFKPRTSEVAEDTALAGSNKRNGKTLPVLEESGISLENPQDKAHKAVDAQLVKMWEQTVGALPVGAHDNFFEMGGNSLLALRLIAQIEKRTGKKVPLSTFMQRPTIASVSRILHDQGWSPNWISLIPIQPSGNNYPLFVVPAAAKTVAEFVKLSHYIGLNHPVYALQHQGLDGQCNPHYRVEDMATHYIKEIRTVQQEGPYFLAGRCFGSKVVYEMAQQLHNTNQKVALLIIIDSGPPRRVRPPYVTPVQQSLVHYLRRSIHHMANGQLTRVVKQKLLILRSSAVNSKNRNIQRVFEAHRSADQSYLAKVYPGKITLIFSEWSDTNIQFDRDRQEWEALAGGGLNYHVIPGDFFTIFEEPYIKNLADQLKFCVNQAVKEKDSKVHPLYSVPNGRVLRKYRTAIF